MISDLRIKDGMVLAVVGSRTFSDLELVEKELNRVRKAFLIREIVTGGAVGSDSLALMYARDNNLPCSVYFPEWIEGRNAGFDRNQKLVDKADIVVAFWDGKSRGTQDTIRRAKLQGKLTIVIRFD